MAQFIFEGRDKTQRTGHEKIAMKNIRNAINWIVGGYYNSLQDGYKDGIPGSMQELIAEVYSSAMNDLYYEDSVCINKAPKEMRFAGEKFCRAYVEWKLENDCDVKDIANEMNW